MKSASSRPNLRNELGKIFKLSIPLMIGQLSQMLIVVVDTVMVGKLGVSELAALSFANALFGFPFIGGIGLLTAITVLGSAAHGDDKPAEARKICRQGFILALGGGTLLFLISLLIFPLLSYLGQPQAVIELAPPFLFLILLSIIPALGSIALKNYSDSLNCPWPAFWIFLGGVGINIPLNFLFIYGWGFVPAMGLTGAGVATLLARSLTLAAMIIWLKKSRKLRAWTPRRYFHPWDFVTLRRLLRLGFPASMHLFAEVGAFSLAGLIIGTFGEKALAAHQIALTTASVAFMVPLGLAMALTVRIGNVGLHKNPVHARLIAKAGWFLTLSITTVSCLTIFFLRDHIAALYVDEKELIHLAASLLVIIGIFQILDGMQVASTGMLRGIQDVKMPAYTAFVCYWLIGLPFGWVLATTGGLGAQGIWWGVAFGLGVAALVLSWRLHRKVSTPKNVESFLTR